MKQTSLRNWKTDLIRQRNMSRPREIREQESPLLLVKRIVFNYYNQSHFTGLKHVSLSLAEGRVLAITGKSGCGKTTLLKCIYGLEDLHAGEIVLDGEGVTGPAYNLIPGHKDIGLVSQDYYVLDNHTVIENISDKLTGVNDEYRHHRISSLLKLLGLQNLSEIPAKNLSAGQKQRVAIARALAVFPRLLLLDEPFSNLDALLAIKLFTFIINESRKKQSSVIVVTHNPGEALRFADEIAIMNGGRLVMQGDKWDVYYNPINSRLAGLLGPFNLVRREDLEKNSAHRREKKLFVRPDRLIVQKHAKQCDLKATVCSSVFNGKCVEILTETKSGNNLLIYSSENFATGTSLSISIRK